MIVSFSCYGSGKEYHPKGSCVEELVPADSAIKRWWVHECANSLMD
jgi:hypothetical protein